MFFLFLLDVPACDFPDKDADQHARSTWLIEICKKHVETYVVSSDVSNLVEQTGILDEKLNEKKFPCRSPECNNTYTIHSRRVRCVFSNNNFLFTDSLKMLKLHIKEINYLQEMG